MSYEYLIGLAIFIACWIAGIFLVESRMTRLTKRNQEAVLEEAGNQSISLGFSYIVILSAAFALFDLFPTISWGLKLACIGAFLTLIVARCVTGVLQFRHFGHGMAKTIIVSYAFTFLGYGAFVYFIRESLSHRIWH